MVPTGVITGCAMFLRMTALDQTGLFWEPLFLYWEDVDLCVRVSRAGWSLDSCQPHASFTSFTAA